MTVEEIRAADAEGHAFAVQDSPGIAFHFIEPETEPDEDTEWTGYEQPTGRVVMVMVGDDRRHSIDPDEVSTLDDDAWCAGCGQIGCGH